MTIKEIEERCGMTRANIRFYEAEGLIDPKRGANGYRDYSQEDVGKVASFFFERHHNEMGLAVLAFVQAQADYPLFDEETKRVADYIFNNLYQDFEFTLHGVHIKYDVEFDREIKMDPMGIRAEDEKNMATCSYEFKMELLEE